jgi:hypothetical protein
MMRFLVWAVVFCAGTGSVRICLAVDAPIGAQKVAGESVLGEASGDEPALRPSAFLIVRGGSGETVYRGWPILIEFQSKAADAKVPGPLVAKGPSQIDPQPAPGMDHVWLISEEKSKSISPGTYTFSVGDVQSVVQVADEPAALSPAEKIARRSVRISYAQAAGDSAGAESLVRDWIKAEPQSVEAQVALGEVLAETGKLSEALTAYQAAIGRFGPGTKPPRELYRRAAEIGAKLAEQAAIPASDAVSAEELAYFKLFAEGDAALKAKKDSVALKAYERAKKYHADHKLTLKLRELEEKIEFARKRQVAPAKPPP